VIALPVAIGTLVGMFIGIVPGAGSAVASFVAYQVIKVVMTKHTDWGEGSAAGLATIDASANASNSGELIPTLALGIPGAPTMVVIMAALATQGIFPGPQLVQTRPELLYATFGGLLLGVVLLAVIGYLMIPPSIYLSTLSPPATMAVTLVLIVAGIFSLRWNLLDVWVCMAAGLLGYFMNRYDYPVAPTALAFILGGMLETNLRRGLVMTGDWIGFVARPITATLLVLALLAFIGGILTNRRIARGVPQPERSAG
jgi:putative tricarboxylic transport membrane protein